MNKLLYTFLGDFWGKVQIWACPELVEGLHPELVEGLHPELVEGLHPELVEGLHPELVEGLPNLDSNQDNQIQSLMSYH